VTRGPGSELGASRPPRFEAAGRERGNLRCGGGASSRISADKVWPDAGKRGRGQSPAAPRAANTTASRGDNAPARLMRANPLDLFVGSLLGLSRGAKDAGEAHSGWAARSWAMGMRAGPDPRPATWPICCLSNTATRLDDIFFFQACSAPGNAAASRFMPGTGRLHKGATVIQVRYPCGGGGGQQPFQVQVPLENGAKHLRRTGFVPRRIRGMQERESRKRPHYNRLSTRAIGRAAGNWRLDRRFGPPQTRQV